MEEIIKTEGAGTPDYTQWNVYQKLQEARRLFLEAGAKKTGKNMHLSFMYFELEDIVPICENIFSKVGLIAVPCITADTAYMNVHDCDHPETTPVGFCTPFTPIQPNKATNEMQALGSSITYIRRYLWMLVMDIVEKDSIDCMPGNQELTPHTPENTKPVTLVKKAPATPESRNEIKTKLTNAAGNADEMQIKALKMALSKLMEVDPTQEEFVQTVAVSTKGFKELSKEKCEELINGVSDMLDNYSKG